MLSIGTLTKWKYIPMGHCGGYRVNKYPMVLSKQPWQINPNECGVTYIQGITREINPDQDVVYLGDYVADANERIVFQGNATISDYPSEL